ncbi:MAG: phospho-N-acetylmuramoyl-pentapeptide-transferase [Nitrospinota bacterium]
MLYHIFFPLHGVFGAFNVFRYISFRSAYAILTGLLISLILGPLIIRALKARQLNETIRSDGPLSHSRKSGTPTMGGLLILLALVFPTLLWADLTNRFVWIFLLITLAFGALGFADDYRKVVLKDKNGLRVRTKFFWQAAIGLGVGAVLYWDGMEPAIRTQVVFPFFKELRPELGWLYIPFAAIVVTATSNGVNLTDGLDGLAIGPFMVAAASYLIITYVAGNAQFASYLNIAYVRGAGELAVVCAAMLGASLGFLWFNAYPAQVFMGDVGALALGGGLGVVALISKQELLLFIVGGIFAIETLSVIVQVVSFKLTGRRIFRMAPLHHHFEEKGWEEPKVIVRFWIIAVVLALLSLSTLKLR